ncbi:MAG: helix-turn-helix transcriptional regulator [Actinobacteria bacterium]|nr:MAG: helix-turn-helix transcriptional regulator [Actinomycetota bacterium]
MSYDVYDRACPTRQVLDRIADRWTALVVGRLEEGTQRFSELQREIGGVSSKMLSQTLRSLERDGLVERTVHPVVPPHVEYRLTPLGETLTEPLAAVREWAEAHIEAVEAAQERYEAVERDPAPWQRPRAVPG